MGSGSCPVGVHGSASAVLLGGSWQCPENGRRASVGAHRPVPRRGAQGTHPAGSAADAMAGLEARTPPRMGSRITIAGSVQNCPALEATRVSGWLDRSTCLTRRHRVESRRLPRAPTHAPIRHPQSDPQGAVDGRDDRVAMVRADRDRSAAPPDQSGTRPCRKADSSGRGIDDGRARRSGRWAGAAAHRCAAASVPGRTSTDRRTATGPAELVLGTGPVPCRTPPHPSRTSSPPPARICASAARKLISSMPKRSRVTHQGLHSGWCDTHG